MTNYYIEKDYEIVIFDENKQKLVDTLLFMPEYQHLEIKETDKIIYNNQLLTEKEYNTVKAQERQEYLDSLYMKSTDVERAIYKARDIDFDDIINMIKEDLSSDINIKDLKIELKAENFYRNHPYIDKIGTMLGFTKEQLDNFFETKDWKKLTKDNEN